MNSKSFASKSMPRRGARVPAKILFIIALSLLSNIRAQASVHIFSPPYTSSSDGSIDPDTGLSDSETISAETASISSFVLTLTITGTAANDISGYIRLGNEESSPAFYLTLGDSYSNDGISYNSYSANNDDVYTWSSTSFNGLDANGSWNLFLFHQTPGFGDNNLPSWELDIFAVPEPTNTALEIFGVAAVALFIFRRAKSLRGI